MKTKGILSVFTLLLGIVIVAGCMSSTTPDISSTTLTKIPTITQTYLSIPKFTGTATHILFPTPSLTVFYTSVPNVPTLTNPSAVVKDLLKTNGRCDLPCIWNLTPGETSMTSAIQFFESLGWKGGYQYSVPVPVFFTGKDIDSNLVIRNELFGENNVLQNISLVIGRNNPPENDYFTLFHILQNNGAPSEIWMLLEGGEVLNPVQTAMDIFLYYQNQDFVIHFSATAVLQNTVYHFCPSRPDLQLQRTGSVNIYASPKGSNTPIADIMAPFGGISMAGWKSVDDVLGMDISTFYKKMIDSNGNACFDTPLKP